MWEPIRQKIKEKLQTVTELQEVEDFPNEQWNGFPCAMVETTRNDADFQTTNANKRVYIFTIYLLQEYESQGPKKARRIIEGVVDSVVNAFDQDQLLTGISLPSNEVMVISYPALSIIYETEKYVVAELELRVITQFSIS